MNSVANFVKPFVLFDIESTEYRMTILNDVQLPCHYGGC